MDRLRIVFTTSPGSIVSWLIRKLTSSDVSHVGIQDGGMVYSAEQDGVVEQSLDEFLKGRRTVRIYEATEEGVKHLDIGRARAHLGDKYGFDEVPGFLLAESGHFTGGFANPKEEVCSEFVLFLDDETGFITEFVGLDRETTTPAKLDAALSKGGPTFTKIFG